ncbi:MAG: hypothetical protein WC538_00470 [Thermoanaerobaculia bacterium]|jgi:hypothetical protein
MPRTTALVVGLVVAIVFVVSASEARGASVDDWCATLRLCDPPPPETATIDILCDLTADCTLENLRLTLDQSLRYCAARPGSIVRLSMMGRTVSDVALIATADSSTAEAKGKKKRTTSAQRFVDRELPRLLAAAQLAMAKPKPSASPIAEALTVVSWAEVRTNTRIIIVLTDARQVSPIADFECKALPDEDTWIRALKANRSLAPYSLDSVSVHFAFVGVTPVAGRKCRVSLERETEIRELWRVAIARAGGMLDITTGPARFAGASNGGVE